MGALVAWRGCVVFPVSHNAAMEKQTRLGKKILTAVHWSMCEEQWQRMRRIAADLCTFT